MSAAPRPIPLRRNLLVAFGIIFVEGILVLGITLMFLLPRLTNVSQVVLFVSIVLAADVVVFVWYGAWYLRRHLLNPVARLVDDVERIARGEFKHRVATPAAAEFQAIGDSVNLMADRMLQDQRRLAENIESLEGTNRELVAARSHVIHAARLATAGTLAAGIAHEVGNPLGAIMAYTDVARKRMAKDGQDTELLDSIRAEALRIDRIVRGLLDYARPEGEDVLPVDPWEVVSEVRELLESQGQLGDVEVEWVAEAGSTGAVIGRHRLKQVLVNLVLNAVDALGEDGGRIEVRVFEEDGPGADFPIRRDGDPAGINYLHRRRVSADDEGREVAALKTAARVVCMSVSDDGPGLDPSTLDHLFDPFFTTKDPGKGTGLGLFICARLVEGLGGRIEAGLSKGGGAMFTIRFPVAGDEATGPESGAGPETAEHGAPQDPAEDVH